MADALAYVREGLTEEGLDPFPKGQDAHTRRRTLAGSMNASLRRYNDDEKQRLYELAIFPDDTAIPQETVLKLWGNTAEVSAFRGKTLLRRIAGHFCRFRVEEDDGEPVLRFHDKIREYLKVQLREHLKRLQQDTPVVHQELLQAYNPDDKAWYEVEDDGYLYKAVAYHLIEAGRQEELYELLTGSPDWMERKFIACVGDWAYDADLEIAIRQFSDPLDANGVLTVSKLWAARQVVNARTDIYKDRDLKTLVWLGREAEAIAYARLRSDHITKASGLLAILDALVESEKVVPDEFLEEIIEIGKQVENSVYKKYLLSSLAEKCIEIGKFDKLYELANESEMILYKLIITLTNRNQIEEALKVTYVQEDISIQFGLLNSIVNHLPENNFDSITEIMQAALEKARQLVEPKDCAYALNTVGQHFIKYDIDLARKTLDESHQQAQKVINTTHKTHVLNHIGRNYIKVDTHQAKEVLLEAAAFARQIDDIQNHAGTLAAIGHSFIKLDHNQAREILDEALRTANEIEDPTKRAHKIISIIHNCEKIYSEQFIQGEYSKVVEMAEHLKENNPKYQLPLKKIALELVKVRQFDMATKVAYLTEEYPTGVGSRYSILEEISTEIAKIKYFEKALDIARKIKDSFLDGSNRARALRNIALEFAKNGQIDKALDTAHQVKKDKWGIFHADGALVYVDIATELIKTNNSQAQAVVDEAFSQARRQNTKNRVHALKEVAYLMAVSGDTRAEYVLNKANNMNREMVNTIEASISYNAIAYILAKGKQYQKARNVLSEAKDGFRYNIGDENNFYTLAVIEMVTDLVQRGQINEAQQLVTELDAPLQVSYFKAIELIKQRRYDEALSIVEKLENGWEQFEAFSAAASNLTEISDDRIDIVINKMLNLARNVQYDWVRASRLKDIARILVKIGDNRADQLFEQAIQAARQIKESLQLSSQGITVIA